MRPGNECGSACHVECQPDGGGNYLRGHPTRRYRASYIIHANEVNMSQKSLAVDAAVFIVLSLVIAGVLEAVFRISNLLNQPINPLLLAAGAISASILWRRKREG